MKISIAIAIATLAACGGDVDEQWDLDHDRIIGVRASKPGLLAGEKAELTGLIGHANDEDPLLAGMTEEVSPNIAIAVQPMSLASAVTTEGGKWYVTAPSDDMINAARAELKIPADQPVPLQVGVQFPGEMNAITVVKLGVSSENPTIEMPKLDGMDIANTSELTFGMMVKVLLEVTISETNDVNWLTSVGQMHDFDLPKAYLRVEKDDPTEGQLAVIVRDRAGGTTWHVWAARAQ